MRRSASATSPRTLLAAVALAGGCDDRVASRIDPHTQWTDEVTVAGRPKLDVLWVIDNSTSMCEEQASLAESLDALTERLLETGADIQAAVVTTDMEDATHRGRFQRTHATDHALSCELPCLTDDACGGECLCGVPFFRRCRANSDCEAGKACKWAPNSLIRHCASTCTFAGPAHDPRSDKCGADTPSQRVFTCQAAAGGTYCLLTPCSDDGDCNGGEGQRCLRAPDGMRYCRHFKSPPSGCVPGGAGECPLDLDCVDQGDGTGRCEPAGRCPPPTCSCPKTLPKVLASQDPDFRRKLRCLATVGTKGDTFEKGLEALRKALDPRMTCAGAPNRDPEDQPFLREDAYLALLIISDENDCSDDVHTCEPGHGGCVACLEDGRCLGGSAEIWMNCVPDPVDLDADLQPVHYCRLPRLKPSECEYLRDWLRPVEDYVAFFRSLKDPPDGAGRASAVPCETHADCGKGWVCSRVANVCIEERVIAGALVGPKHLRCVEACPSEQHLLDCVPADGCPEPCEPRPGEESFCADRVYHSPATVHPTCAGHAGAAYNGRRYVDFVAAFGGTGIHRSICGTRGDFRAALEAIGDRAAQVMGRFCLSRPLLWCRDDDECDQGRRCLLGGVAADSGTAGRCVDADGRLQDLSVEVLEAVEERGARQPRPRAGPVPEYAFLEGAGPAGLGCVHFTAHGPAPGETVRLTYRTTPVR